MEMKPDAAWRSLVAVNYRKYMTKTPETVIEQMETNPDIVNAVKAVLMESGIVNSRNPLDYDGIFGDHEKALVFALAQAAGVDEKTGKLPGD